MKKVKETSAMEKLAEDVDSISADTALGYALKVAAVKFRNTNMSRQIETAMDPTGTYYKRMVEQVVENNARGLSTVVVDWQSYWSWVEAYTTLAERDAYVFLTGPGAVMPREYLEAVLDRACEDWYPADVVERARTSGIPVFFSDEKAETSAIDFFVYKPACIMETSGQSRAHSLVRLVSVMEAVPCPSSKRGPIDLAAQRDVTKELQSLTLDVIESAKRQGMSVKDFLKDRRSAAIQAKNRLFEISKEATVRNADCVAVAE
jgi:hypothetical protein